VVGMKLFADRARDIVNSTFIGAVLANRIFEWMMVRKPHDPDYPLLALLLRGDSGCVIDVGANYGQSSRFFAQNLRVSRLVAIEPVALSARRKMRLRRQISQIEIVEAMCGRSAAQFRPFWVPKIGPFALDQASSSDLPSLRARMRKLFPIAYRAITFRESQIRTVTVDGLAENPMFLKIDVEGSELACLEGSMLTLTQSKPVLLVEATENRTAIVQFLAGLGYELFIRERNSLLAYNPDLNSGSVRNIIGVHPQGFGRREPLEE